MRKTIQIQVSPDVAADPIALKKSLADETAAGDSNFHFRILKRSIDARGRKVRINLTVEVSTDLPVPEEKINFEYRDVSKSDRICHIIGAGPAGLFAALSCLEKGIKPVVIERGKDVRSRRRDLAAINKEHLVNPESNYCFGEGGAGTYSDGKLYTRSNKRGDIHKILKTLVFHGATRDILIDAHPHIGTNKLPALIQNIRETIIEHGGEVWFESKLVDLEIKKDKISSVVVQRSGSATTIPIQQIILATGHSARDIYELLHSKKILVEAKPFALGVRVEHPQELIDQIQYHCQTTQQAEELREHLPAASYSLVQQVKGRGVYSFCMCPGGIIAPCATAPGEVVTNGWSPSKRNNPYANSGIVVGLELSDYKEFSAFGPLAGLEFQKKIEKNAWFFGGKTQTAPAQRLVDFVNGKLSADLPDCSYQPGLKSVQLGNVLTPLIADPLKHAFKAFGGTMRGYFTNSAVVVGVESRTSTPVRIPRDKEKLNHPQLTNLYPCGEGAGYAGGIVSAAMDGERCVSAISF